MESQAYYHSFAAINDNIERRDCFIGVNCSGCCILENPFASHNLKGRNDYYLQYLVSGRMVTVIDGQQYIMQPGQAVLYYPHTEYKYWMHENETVHYLWVHFTGNGIEALLGECKLKNKKIMEIGVSETVIHLFERMFHEFIVRDGCFEQSLTSILISICIETSRRYLRTENSYNLEMDKRIQHSIAYIHKNYHAQITVEHLASLEHLSVGRYRYLFKRTTGFSPVEYLTRLRVSHSIELLFNTDLSIKEIANATGYSDQLYFSRIFKQYTGQPPSQYK